jgi:hypothetical protein
MFRTISKIDNLDFPGISSYLARYKEFSDLMSSLVKLLGTEELTVERSAAASAILDRSPDPDPAFYLNADPDPASQTIADPDPSQTLLSQKLGI